MVASNVVQYTNFQVPKLDFQLLVMVGCNDYYKKLSVKDCHWKQKLNMLSQQNNINNLIKFNWVLTETQCTKILLEQTLNSLKHFMQNYVLLENFNKMKFIYLDKIK